MVTHSQDGRGGVWATYGASVGIVGVHRSPWFQGELACDFFYTANGGGGYDTPPQIFPNFPKAYQGGLIDHAD